MRNAKEIKSKIDAAQSIFSESTTTISKLRSARTMLSGINPRMDAVLAEYDALLSKLENMLQGDMVSLSVEAIPEDTEDGKKRKAALLLFLKSWNDLKGEVARVEQSLAESGSMNDVSVWGKIASGAKGPLAIVTVLAVGIALLQTTAVEIEISNNGCSTLESSASLPFPIPGFSLPEGSIPSGESATAMMPPFSFESDGTTPDLLSLTAISFTLSFDISGVDDIVFDDTSLLGKKTSISLSGNKKHTLAIICR